MVRQRIVENFKNFPKKNFDKLRLSFEKCNIYLVLSVISFLGDFFQSFCILEMAEGFDNENFVPDEIDDTITLLFLGLTRAGKTSIIQVNFGQFWTHLLIVHY